MFIPMYGILLLIRFFAVITKYTVLDEQRREAKEGKSQRKKPSQHHSWGLRNPTQHGRRASCLSVQK